MNSVKLNATQGIAGNEKIQLSGQACLLLKLKNYFLRSAGLRITRSGETFRNPKEVSTFSLNSNSAKSKGVCPLSPSLATELMWQVMSLTSSEVSLLMLRPLGMM